MSEWMPYYFELSEHERIEGADLSHLAPELQEVWRCAMRDLYWQACVRLQKARSNDGLISKQIVWGPLQARKTIALELEKVGMLEDRGSHYYPRNYLEKNRTGDQIRGAQDREKERKRASRGRPSGVRPDTDRTDAGRRADSSVTSVCDSAYVSVSEDRKGDPVSLAGREEASAVRMRPVDPDGAPTPPPADVPITDEIVAQCEMAGARAPTKADVVAMLNDRRKRAKKFVDWGAELVTWMINQKTMDAQARDRERDRRERVGGPLVQPVPPTGRLWKVGNE